MQPGMDIARIQAYAQGSEDRRHQRESISEQSSSQPKRARQRQSSYVSGSQQQVGSGQEVMPPPRCATCGKRHVGLCRQGVCYTCGDPGHYARDCPQKVGSIVPENSVTESSPSVRAPEIGLQTSSDRGRGQRWSI
ncbi:DEAD-box ATP-dependent RNA helicase 3A, chloroplastic-like [Lycium barbarum]|uniref:DEAD-box ATP-dependent RNA helicase 3A, chloroplastic-like n=1 Tax=Lycium barbarum TaxID=112863 RepID=UPI00293E6A70|nr:DEAD-box ATP-dependent RNA helicase 3A, chloroplastic-like [Lycium barbarum]